MKDYLNKEERKDVCFVAGIAGLIDDMLEKWNMTKEEHKYLSSARTFLYKWLDLLFSRLEKNYAEKLLRDLKVNEIVMLPNYEAKRRFNEALQQIKEDDVIIKYETLLNLIEHALVGCTNCKKDFNNCDIYQVFIEMEVEPFDCNPPKGVCPYCVVKRKAII